jgi:hypothetical protein
MPEQIIVTAALSLCVTLGWTPGDGATRHDIVFHRPDLTRIEKVHSVTSPYEWCPDEVPLDFRVTVVATRPDSTPQRSEILEVPVQANMDFNHDGVVGPSDFLLIGQMLSSQYGMCNPDGTMVIPCGEDEE